MFFLFWLSYFNWFYKNWCCSYKNKLFWVLIFSLCQKFDMLLSSQKFWSCSKNWARSWFSKLDLNWNWYQLGDCSIDKFCKNQCYGRKNQLFQDLIFLLNLTNYPGLENYKVAPKNELTISFWKLLSFFFAIVTCVISLSQHSYANRK